MYFLFNFLFEMTESMMPISGCALLHGLHNFRHFYTVFRRFCAVLWILGAKTEKLAKK